MMVMVMDDIVDSHVVYSSGSEKEEDLSSEDGSVVGEDEEVVVCEDLDTALRFDGGGQGTAGHKRMLNGASTKCVLQETPFSSSSSSSSSCLDEFHQKSGVKRIKSMPKIAIKGYGFCSTQGLRGNMEDFIKVENNILKEEQGGDEDSIRMFYSAIFDGHAGDMTSQLLHDNLDKRFARRIQKTNKNNNGVLSAKDMEQMITSVFLEYDLELLQIAREMSQCNVLSKTENIWTHHQKKGLRYCKMKRFTTEPNFKEESQRPREFASGSTATVLLSGSEDSITLGWVGDSRAVICSRKEDASMVCATPLTVDHRAAMESERKRITRLGGTVSKDGRLYMDLNLSRAFGSFRHKTHDLAASSFGGVDYEQALQHTSPLSVIPQVVSHNVRKNGIDLFVVLASDGLWDVLSNQQVVEFVHNTLTISKDPVFTANRLVEKALQEGSTDNISATILLLDDHYIL